MSQREVQKKRDVFIEEDKDFYLSFLNKKLRNSRKKLEQIDELSKKDAKSLKPEQVEKINSRVDVANTVQHYEELKDLYYTAYKTSLEEGRIAPKETSIEKNGKTNQGNETATAAQAGEQFGISKDEIIKDTIQKVLNLLNFSQVIENPVKRDRLTRSLESESKSIENLTQFCQDLNLSIFGAVAEERRNETLEKLNSYVRSEETLALGENTFKSFQEILEKIMETSSFKNTNQVEKESLGQVETIEKNEEPEKVEQESSTGAAFLKPDTSDANASPENVQYLPKVVKFVDEIEKDLEAQSPNQINNAELNQTEPVKGILKESTKEADVNVEAQGTQEQKSFRKNKNNDYGQKSYYNDRRNNKGGQSYNGKKSYSGYNENRYPRGSYQVKQYVEKKPQEV